MVLLACLCRRGPPVLKAQKLAGHSFGASSVAHKNSRCGCHAFTICHREGAFPMYATPAQGESEKSRDRGRCKTHFTLQATGAFNGRFFYLQTQSGVGGTWRKAHVPPPDPPAVHRCTTALAVIVSPAAAPSTKALRVGRWSAKAHTRNPDLLGAVKAGRTLVGRKLHEGVGQEELVSQ